MRNHEDFMAEIYSRKNEYIKEKKRKRKIVLTFAVPFTVLILGCSVMILPAMLPAEKSADGAAITENQSEKAVEQRIFAKITADGKEKIIDDEAQVKELVAAIDMLTAVPEFATEAVTESDTQASGTPATSQVPENNYVEIEMKILSGGGVIKFTLSGNVLKNSATGEAFILSDAQLKKLNELI